MMALNFKKKPRHQSIKYRSLLYFIFLLALSTCNKKENLQPQAIIESDFKIYVDRFISEAASRGYKINDDQLSVIYSDTMNYYCGYGIFDTKQVLVSSVHGSCWQTQSDINREILMFHELGHALLARNHDASKLPNGDFKTMMCGGNAFVNLFTLYNEDTPERRKYYLDELFNPLTPPPGWAAEKTKATLIFNDTLSVASNSWIYKSSGTQQGILSTSVFFSPSTSLEIKSSGSPSSSASYWYKIISPDGINQSDKLVLKVNIKLQNVEGSGAYIALYGDTDSKTIFFQSNARILARNNWDIGLYRI